jgi:prepilin-type processing-associated H-X9-DG protein
VLELLISISVIGALGGLLLPAIQAAREAGRRTECLHNLRQIGVALQLHDDSLGKFPAGWKTAPRAPTALCWASALLPYLDAKPLDRLVDRCAGVDAPANGIARSATLPTFLCPSDVAAPRFALFKETADHETGGRSSAELLVELPAANYVGVFGSSDPDGEPYRGGEGPFVRDDERTLREFVRGASQTLLAGERTARKLPATWLGIHLGGEDAAGRVAGQAWLGPNRPDADECEFDSRHPGGVDFLWGDGHAAWLGDDVNVALYRRLARLQE